MRNKTILLGILLSIVFFIVAFITSGSVLEWALYSSKDVKFMSSSMADMFRQTFIYSLVVGLIPITLVLVWQITPVETIRKRLLSALMIIAFIMLAGFLRCQWVKVLAREATDYVRTKHLSSQSDLQDIFPISRVHLGIYMMVGLLIGSVVAYFIFRNKKKTIPQFSFDN